MRTRRGRGPLLGVACLATLLMLPDELGANVPSCGGRPATLVRVGGDVAVKGTSKADVIVTGGGDDWVIGGGGVDRICTGRGEDRVLGGIGSDLVATGAGDDLVEGGNGSDRVLAGSGRDRVIGNRGNDRLYGEAGAGDFVNGGLGDDVLAGGSGGFDQLIGDIGNDEMHGGAGDGDVMRGDRGADLFDGGPGARDAATFALSGANGNIVGGRGVEVDLSAGVARNDGSDQLTHAEDVIGTPFVDSIVGDGAVNALYGGGGDDRLIASGGGDLAFGGPGSDECTGFDATDSCGPEPLSKVQRFEVDLAGGPGATALTAVFRQGDFTLSDGLPSPPPLIPIAVTVSFRDSAWLVREEPLPLSLGDRCEPIAPAEARCPVQGVPDAVYVDGGKAGDLIEINPNMPKSVYAQLRGEYGADTLIGGPGDDNLDGSPSDQPVPKDVLKGRGGSDSLFSGSLLDGGGGSDLLIAFVCSGQRIGGGAGIDSVSFARQQGGVRAELGGTATFAPLHLAHQDLPGGCGPTAAPAQIESSVERIEGSRFDDVLIGDAGANILLGRAGDDLLFGGGGGDLLVGGEQRDWLAGDSGFDRLYGNDGGRDQRLDCGDGSQLSGIAKVDDSDPPALHCRVRG